MTTLIPKYISLGKTGCMLNNIGYSKIPQLAPLREAIWPLNDEITDKKNGPAFRLIFIKKRRPGWTY